MIESRIDAIEKIGELFKAISNTNSSIDKEKPNEIGEICRLAYAKNQWFTIENQMIAAENWAKELEKINLISWLEKYPNIKENSKTVGIVCAGNIPWVGLHDWVCAFVCGYNIKIKLSSKDEVLMKYVIDKLIESHPKFKKTILIEEKLENIDFLIATGTNNTSRYFDYYFQNIPRIIRKNRTSVAVVSQENTDDDLKELAKDVFLFFGLGCRSVTQIFLPKGFDFNRLAVAFDGFKHLKNHNKYANNYDYQKAINLVNNKKFMDFDFFLLEENSSLHSPIGSLYYSLYEDLKKVKNTLVQKKLEIQTVVGSVLRNEIENTSNFGKAQKPKITDYADKVDTIKILLQDF